MKFKHPKLSLMLFAFAVILTASVAPIGFTFFGPVAATANTFTINNGATYTNTTTVNITLQFDPAANITQMHFSNDGLWSDSDWENYTTNPKLWNLTAGDGEKTVYLEFKDVYNQVAAASQKITLDMTAPTPVVNLGIVSLADRSAYFDAGYSTDNYGIANCTWDFGDGNQSVAVSTNHIYASNGNYSGWLTVTDLAGNSANSTFWVNFPDTVAATPTPYQTVEPTFPPSHTASPQPAATPTPTQNQNSPVDIILPITIVVVVVVMTAIVVVVVARSGKTKS